MRDLTPDKDRPRLAVVTPLPPLQSGVAQYSAFTFSAVASVTDLVIYTDTKSGPAPIPGAELKPYSMKPYVDRDYDAVISVVGNSHFHIPVMEYFLELGGACIAHDPRMTELYYFWRGSRKLAEIFSRHTDRPVSSEQVPGLLEKMDELPSIGYDEIAPRARPLLVHSTGMAERILEDTGVKPLVLPYVPHHVPVEKSLGPETAAAARQKLGWQEDKLHIVSFGLIDLRTKANDVILDAVALLRQWGIDCQIHFVGTGPELELEKLMRRALRLGISSALHLAGWAPADVMDDYLLAADAAVQLRTYALAPLSGALLDCMAFGLPSIATESLAAEMNAPAYIRGIPDRFSGLLLAEALGKVLESRRLQSSEAIEPLRHDWMAERTGAVYASSLLDALGFGGAPS